jgi:hypothetical protein
VRGYLGGFSVGVEICIPIDRDSIIGSIFMAELISLFGRLVCAPGEFWKLCPVLILSDNLSRFLSRSVRFESQRVLLRTALPKFFRLLLPWPRTGCEGNFMLLAIRPRTGNSESPSPSVLPMLDVGSPWGIFKVLGVISVFVGDGWCIFPIILTLILFEYRPPVNLVTVLISAPIFSDGSFLFF